MHGTLLDSPPRTGMPAENLAALKEFLEMKRGDGALSVTLPKLCRTLPVEIQKELALFIGRVKATKYFKEDADFRVGWKNLSIGNTWLAARQEALKNAEKKQGNINNLYNYMLDVATVAANKNARIEALEAMVLYANEIASGVNPAHADLLGRDMILSAALIIVGDLGLEGGSFTKEVMVEHARKRMDVWERGFGLVCDSGGELFIYHSLERL